jgi:hypothetical protein
VSFLPLKDQAYLASRGLTPESVEYGGQKAVIFRAYKLPVGQFDAAFTDVLVILPHGYPDAPPDMFFTFPWIRVLSTGGWPSAADNSVQFANVGWQRWSRHNNEWRPGKDGIWTMLKRIQHALETAK